MGISNPSLTDHVSNETILAHHACTSFVTAPTRITLVVGQTGLSYRACDERRLVSSC